MYIRCRESDSGDTYCKQSQQRSSDDKHFMWLYSCIAIQDKSWLLDQCSASLSGDSWHAELTTGYCKWCLRTAKHACSPRHRCEMGRSERWAHRKVPCCTHLSASNRVLNYKQQIKKTSAFLTQWSFIPFSWQAWSLSALQLPSQLLNRASRAGSIEEA